MRGGPVALRNPFIINICNIRVTHLLGEHGEELVWVPAGGVQRRPWSVTRVSQG
jgi:hypothetical protein